MKLKKILFSPVTTLLAFVLAAALLLFSSVGGARAALTIVSQTYQSQLQMYDIGVTLVENGQNVAWRNYNRTANGSWNEHTIAVGNAKLLDALQGQELALGQAYNEVLEVTNSGSNGAENSINQYVRVTIYRYWADKDGQKLPDRDPKYIKLDLDNIVSGTASVGWLEDTAARTDERTVLYYDRLLPAGSTSLPFAKTLTIDGGLKAEAHTVREGNTTYTVYDYDGVQFVLEVRVDAVQENNATDAVRSAWGRQVQVDENARTLALR